MILMTETVGLKVQGGPTGETDPYGNEIYAPPTTTAHKGWFEPRSSTENTDARNQQISGYWVYLPLGADLSGSDAVVLFGAEQDGSVVGGVEYQVVGEPGVQPGGFIVEGYQQAAVERVTG